MCWDWMSLPLRDGMRAVVDKLLVVHQFVSRVATACTQSCLLQHICCVACGSVISVLNPFLQATSARSTSTDSGSNSRLSIVLGVIVALVGAATPGKQTEHSFDDLVLRPIS